MGRHNGPGIIDVCLYYYASPSKQITQACVTVKRNLKMSVVTTVPEPNLWKEICKEHEQQIPTYQEPELESVNTDLHDYDPSKHTPIFYGPMHLKLETDIDIINEVDPSISHPASVGHAFINKPPQSPPVSPRPLPDHEKCSPKEYLQSYVFPSLLPAMIEMLKHAKKEKCFERKRTRFNALDFLTEYLYNHNAKPIRSIDNTYLDIDFVKEHLKTHPRPPLPLSLLWTEEEASLIIQSFWRGYRARKDPEIQELREWQKMWLEDKENVSKKVNEFWDKKMPNHNQNDGIKPDQQSTNHENGGNDNEK